MFDEEKLASVLPGYVCAWSPCKSYRYTLWRVWDPGLPFVQFIGLNPSTADEKVSDPTVTRCINFAKAWECGGMCMTNAFALRDTDPKVMLRADDPIGPENNEWLRSIYDVTKYHVACWGAHGMHRLRHYVVVKMLKRLDCLKRTKGNLPSHPLYLRGDLRPTAYALRGEVLL